MYEETILNAIFIWIIAFGAFSFVARRHITNLLLKIRIPSFIPVIVLAIPLTILYEYIVCPGNVMDCVIIEFPPIIIAFIIVFIIQKLASLRYISSSALFASLIILFYAVYYSLYTGFALKFAISYIGIDAASLFLLGMIPFYYAQMANVK